MLSWGRSSPITHTAIATTTRRMTGVHWYRTGQSRCDSMYTAHSDREGCDGGEGRAQTEQARDQQGIPGEGDDGTSTVGQRVEPSSLTHLDADVVHDGPGL